MPPRKTKKIIRARAAAIGGVGVWKAALMAPMGARYVLSP
jgi:hypothetical protein